MPSGEVWKDLWARSLPWTLLEQALSNRGLAGEKVLKVDGMYASIAEVYTSTVCGGTTLGSFVVKQ